VIRIHHAAAFALICLQLGGLKLISLHADAYMIGWILVILVAVLMLYVADAVVYVVTWLVAYLDAALSALGVHIEVFQYLDMLYPYFRSAVQIIAIGVILIAVIFITMSIRERV
jgi:hypothetical protein